MDGPKAWGVFFFMISFGRPCDDSKAGGLGSGGYQTVGGQLAPDGSAAAAAHWPSF